MTEQRELVRAWIAWAGQSKPESDYHWAWDELRAMVGTDVDRAWSIVLLLVQKSPTDAILASIAAGPLEDLIRQSSNVLMDRVEAEARRDPKFRRCLTGVWLPQGLPHGIRERLDRYTSAVTDPL